MDSKAAKDDQNDSIVRSTEQSGDRLLDRRAYLKLSAAAVGLLGAGAAGVSTASAAEERNGIEFERVVDAVDDLGFDPSGDDRIDGDLEDVASEGDTLVQFPPGEYLVGGTIDVDGDNFGIESTTGDREDVVFRPVEGREVTMFHPGGNPSGFYVGHVTFDRRDEWDSSISLMRGNFADAVYVTDIEIAGWAPEATDSIAKFNIKDPNGSALIDGVTQTGPIQYGAYPHGTTLAFFNGEGTEGDITYRNLDIRAASESGIYAGKAYGTIRVEDSYFKNCAHSAIRVTGEDSWIKNTTVVMDIDDLHPDSEVTDPEGAELNRGIWIQSAEHEHAGPLIEDCEIIINNAGPGVGGIVNHGDTGGSRIVNTRVRCDQDDVYPILIQEESDDDAGSPHTAVLDGVSVTGEGSGRPAIEIRGREGTTVRNSCIQMPNTDGIKFVDSSAGTIEDTNLNVGGEATVFENADIETSNLTSGDSCPTPNPDSWRGDDEGDEEEEEDTSESDDSSSEDESTSEDQRPSENRIVIAQAREGEVTRYEFRTSGGIATGEYAGEEPDGNSVSGRVGPTRGVDDFYVGGYVREFTGENLDYGKVYFADSDVDLDVDNYVLENADDLREVDPAVLGENVLTVESKEERESEFEFSVSEDVYAGATGGDATISDGAVTGSTTDLAAFHFTGSVADIAVTDPENVTVSINDEPVDDVATIGEDESGEENGDESEEYPNTLSIVSEGSVSSYSFTVSGEIVATGEMADDLEDNISSKSAEGAIDGGTHEYRFSGELSDFSIGDGATMYLNGEELGGDEDEYEHLIIFDGSHDDEVSSYKFSVSGSVRVSEEHTTKTDGEWDSLESEVDEDSAIGIVHQGTDAYRFSGDIETLELRGSAVMNFQATE